MKCAVVTGGTGFLGRHMIQLLEEKGYEIYAIVRPGSRNMNLLPTGNRIHVVSCELDELEDCIEEFPKQCDVFYHFAWGGVNREEIDSDAVHEENIRRSLCCVRAAQMLKCKAFVDAGSRIEYGRCEDMFSEELECHPLVAYGRAKIEFSRQAKELCKSGDMKFIHARIFSVYGSDDHPWSLIYTCVTKMLKNEPIDLSQCLHSWNFMAVEDTADLLLTFYEQRDKIPAEDNYVFNVATGDIRPLREFIESIRELTDSNSVLNFGAFAQGAESAMSIKPCMKKVERVFGWQPKISFEEGISRMITVLKEDI